MFFTESFSIVLFLDGWIKMENSSLLFQGLWLKSVKYNSLLSKYDISVAYVDILANDI